MVLILWLVGPLLFAVLTAFASGPELRKAQQTSAF